jgi:hypothetical protein
MRRFLFALIALVASAWAASPNLLLLGAGAGGGSGAPYVFQGIGDLGLSSVTSYWGLRCYSTSYTGIVADIWDSATGSTTETQLTCSSGGVINQTVNILSVTCAAGCSVKTLYDQVANSTSAASNMTQATNANRPAFLSSGCGYSGGAATYQYCMQGTTATVQYLTTGTITSISQVFDLNIVGMTTEHTLNQFAIAAISGPHIAWGTSSGTIAVTFGTQITLTGATQGVWHTIFGEGNGNSSYAQYDTTSSGAVAGGSDATGTKLALGASTSGGTPYTGFIAEAFITSAANEASWGNIQANQNTYWGL